MCNKEESMHQSRILKLDSSRQEALSQSHSLSQSDPLCYSWYRSTRVHEGVWSCNDKKPGKQHYKIFIMRTCQK